jgi:CHAT domain-containing protein
MFASIRLRFKIVVLFLVSVSFCPLSNSLLAVGAARSQESSINLPAIYVVKKASQIKTAEAGNHQQQTEQESLARTLIDKSLAYNERGQFRFSIPLLQQAISIGQKSHNQEITIVAQGVLGNAYILAGQYDEALKAYQTILKLAEEISNEKYIIIALNGQVSIRSIRQKKYLTQVKEAQVEKDSAEVARISALAEQELNAAKELSNRALQVSKTVGGIPEFKALLNGIKLFFDQEELVAQYQQQAIFILDSLPNSRSKAYSLIQLAEYQTGDAKVDSLKKASAVSNSLGDLRTQSFALGALGRFYEQAGQLKPAMELTRQAQNAADLVRATDSLYLWQWQAGRIHTANGAPEEAISAYKNAISSLQSIRGDIVTANTDLQFDVRDSVEPVYRELMALLLDKGQAQEALDVSELLKITELQSFFGDECLQISNALNITQPQVKSKQAVINSVILSNRTYTILRLPDGTLKSYPVSLNVAQIQKQVEQFRALLQDVGTDKYLEPAQKLYDLLLRLMEADLTKSKSSTLVFINDGILRNVPMAALHDGKQFLVQKYAVSNSLGLGLTKGELPKKEQKALVFGLTVEVPPFDSLPGVNAETQAVNDILGGNRFLDGEFTLANLEKQIVRQKNYSVLHLATHGKFSGTANNTFLQAMDRRISLREFENALLASKEPVDLLTLSACQTAAGDNRATLGIAGLAARTGVKNVLASLWFVNDADTVNLMENFYNQLLQNSTSKAEALRNAQISLIPNLHPAIWSSFILVGN